ncbi:hypothetical protein [Niveibacterium terrae]|uniref:hypothetical protein n=1 Tax=Niveibacterium terrae TaxID=3373598 RepID=UPI003A95CC82
MSDINQQPLDETGSDQLISTAEQIRNNLNFALDASPDREAEARRLSVATNTPIESVRAQPDAVKQLAAQQSFDALGVAAHHPELGRFMTGLDNVRLIHDDIPATAAVESAVRSVARAPVATKSAIDMLMPGGQAQPTHPQAPAPSPSGDWTSPITAAVQGLGGAWNKGAAALNMVLGAAPSLYGSATGDTRAQDWWFRNMVDPMLNRQQAFELAPGAGLGSKATHTAGSLLGMLSQITLGGTGGTPAALAPAAGIGETVGAAVEHSAKSMLLPALSDSINVGREVFQATGDGAAAARAATAQYMSTTAAGVIPLSAPGKLAARVGSGFVSGAAMGEVSRQGMNLALPPEMQSGFDWENTFLSGVAGSVLSIAGPRAVPDGVFDAVRRTYTDAARAEEAMKTGQAMQDLSEAATNAKLRERAPDDFKAFVKNVAGEGELQNVWVDGKTLVEGLQQSGLSIDQLREQLPDVASQINESLHTDGLVRIPVEDYATHIAGSPLDGALLQSLRSTPDGMTFAEAKDFQAKQSEAMPAEAKSVSAEAEARAQKIESKNAIRDSVKAQLDATKRLRPDVTSRYADLTSAYYVTQAERMGISPEELLAQHPLKVQAENLSGDQLSQDARGAYDPTSNTITLGKDADLSTFLHEAGHAFMTMHLDMADQIGKLADKTEGQSRMTHDAQRLMDWFGVKDLDAWKAMTLDEQRDSHEKFARGFEQYLLDGKAPGVRLQRIFQDFRAWLLHLYRSAAGLNVEVSPDIRGVMDRMLASESDIRDAESVRGMKPLFDVKPEGMSDEEFANYQRLGNNASADALDSLESRSLRDMQWLTNAKGRELKRLQKEAEGKREEVKKEVTEEVMSEPVEQARRFIQRGELDSGDRTNAQRRIIEDASMGSTKLSLDDLKLMYGEGPAAPWRYLKSAGKYAEVTAKGGLHPDLVAELFGYGSGDAMVRDLLHKETAEQKIEAITDARMLERHGNLTSPDALERMAEAAIHNTARAKFIAAEMAALSKATGSARALALAAKEAADAAISAKRVKDVTPGQYTVAEARSSRAADSAFKKGDIAEAARLKRAQLLNNQLARSALKAQEDIAKSLAYFKRFDKDSIRSKMEPADRDVIDGLLERFDFRKNPPDGPTRKQVQLSEWIESQRALGYSPVVDPSIADPSVRAHYTEMTVEQMRGLTATVKAVEQLARERKTVSIDGQRIELRDAIAPMLEKMKARGEKFTDAQLAERPRYGVDPLWTVTLDRLQSFLRAGFAEFLRTDYKANRYDLHELLGPFQRAISEPLIGASYEYGDRMDAIARLKKQRVEEYGLDREWQDTLRTVVEGHNLADNSIPGHTKRRLTRMDLLGIAMHVGNESNFAKLAEGMQWEPSEIWRALHDNMTEKDWNAVRTMGELSGQGWEDSVAMNRRLGNDQPEKVEPRPFMTKFGEMPGWYAPIGYDPIRSKLGTRQAEELAMNPADGLFGRSYYRSDTTTNGSLNERTGYKDFIDLDFSHIEKRIADTQRDLAYRERLIDAHKIITNPEFAQQFKRTYGPEEHKSLINWLGRLVNAEVGDERQSKLTAILATTRRAMVANGVALRISTMLKHGGSAGAKSSGYFAGGGGSFFAARVAKMATNYSADVEEALAKFPEIRQRYRQQDRDLGRAQTNIMEPESIHGKAERFGHAGVAWLDFLTAVPTANAAYDWATTKGIPKRLGGDGKPMSHADAVKFASKIVREAHSSTAEASQSMLVTNKSEIVKTLTTLHGFMNNAFGQNADTFDKLLHANGYGTPELFARAFAAQIVPGIAAGWVSFGGPNEDESYLMWAFHHIAGEFAGMIPLVRDAFSAAEGRRDAGQVPLFRAISDSYKVAKDASHPSEAKQPIKNFGNVAGLVLPGLGQVGSTSQFLYDEATGAQQAETVGEWARGVMSGKAKHR